MKKLFISQPMKDKTDEEIKAVRKAIIADVSKLVCDEVEVIDSFFFFFLHDVKALWFL